MKDLKGCWKGFQTNCRQTQLVLTDIVLEIGNCSMYEVEWQGLECF